MDEQLYIWLGKKTTSFFDDRGEMYGKAGDDWICAVIIANSQERALELMQCADEANPFFSNEAIQEKRWTWHNLGVAEKQRERIETLAFGLY
jgi:hypothetical protein